MRDRAPEVGRPRGAAWRTLQNEGIVWEGQVLIAGDDVDLASRLIVTHQHLAFVRGGGVALAVDREWLRPSPALRRDGVIHLQVTPPRSRRSEQIEMTIEDGRLAAAHLVSLLTGSGVRPVASTLVHTPSEPEPPRVLPERPSTEPPVRARPKPERSPVEWPTSSPRPRREASDAWESSARLPSLADLKLDNADEEDAVGIAPSASETDVGGAMFAPVGRTAVDVGQTRAYDWNLRPIEGLSPRDQRGRRAWIIRLSGLVLLLALVGAAAYRADLPTNRGRDVASNLPGSSAEPTQTALREVAVVDPSPTPTAELPIARETTDPVAPPEQTAIAIGVGGNDAPTATAEPAVEPSPTEPATSEPAPTDTAAPTPTDEPRPSETTAPTTPPSESPTDAPTPTDQPEPTPTETAPPPTATDTAAPTATETAVPTDVPTATPAPAPTATEPPSSSVRDQDATVRRDEQPEPVLAGGAFRYTIEAAARGAELAELALPNAGGEWVVLVVHAANWSDENAVLAMSDFRIAPRFAPAASAPLDATTEALARFLGFVPAYTPEQEVLFAPGEGHRVALVFFVGAGSGDLTLLAGDAALDLASALARPSDFTDLGASPAVPDLIAGTVVDVIDGRTIEVAVGEERIAVRYLGVAVPTGDACYAAESTALNADLTLGQAVWLERENKNRAGDGVIRDVWLAGPDGGLRLVAAELVAQGAAVPAPAEPDTRFAAWLTATGDAARSAGRGLWGICGGLQQ